MMHTTEFTTSATVLGTSELDQYYALGMAAAAGRDGQVDLVEAHMWMNIAAVKGHDGAVDTRNEIAASMSKMELAQALRRAREWMTVH